MSKISIAIATFNEQDNLGRCLTSVADWVDEIIVVDGSSSDDTVKIANKYKSKVIITKNPINFHINKQKAIEACTGEWILQLDADEVVSEELKREISEIVHQSSNRHPEFISGSRSRNKFGMTSMLKQVQHDKEHEPINGYWIPRKNYFLGKFLEKGGQYPDYTLRLYKKGKGKLPAKSVHEQAQVDGKVGYLKNSLLHYPYKDFSEYLTHFDRYTSIFALELEEQKIIISLISIIKYCIILPKYWFFLTFFRHRGFEDGFPGFVFSFFSSIRFPASFVKYWEKSKKNRQK